MKTPRMASRLSASSADVGPGGDKACGLECGEPDNTVKDEERLVDDFYAETDKWIDQNTASLPTMKDVENFVAMFNKVPKNRKEECLPRALNLIPDKNVLLLTGILIDKSQDKNFVKLVYNDILNRDTSIKEPILRKILEDKDHSCWEDTAWIFEVTGEKPKN